MKEMGHVPFQMVLTFINNLINNEVAKDFFKIPSLPNSAVSSAPSPPRDCSVVFVGNAMCCHLQPLVLQMCVASST